MLQWLWRRQQRWRRSPLPTHPGPRCGISAGKGYSVTPRPYPLTLGTRLIPGDGVQEQRPRFLDQRGVLPQLNAKGLDGGGEGVGGWPVQTEMGVDSRQTIAVEFKCLLLAIGGATFRAGGCSIRWGPCPGGGAGLACSNFCDRLSSAE